MPASARNRSTSRDRSRGRTQHLDHRDRPAEPEVLAAIHDAHPHPRESFVHDAVRAAERRAADIEPVSAPSSLSVLRSSGATTRTSPIGAGAQAAASNSVRVQGLAAGVRRARPLGHHAAHLQTGKLDVVSSTLTSSSWMRSMILAQTRIACSTVAHRRATRRARRRRAAPFASLPAHRRRATRPHPARALRRRPWPRALC